MARRADMQWRVAILVPRVDLGAEVHQLARRADPSPPGGDVQGCLFSVLCLIRPACLDCRVDPPSIHFAVVFRVFVRALVQQGIVVAK